MDRGPRKVAAVCCLRLTGALLTKDFLPMLLFEVIEKISFIEPKEIFFGSLKFLRI